MNIIHITLAFAFVSLLMLYFLSVKNIENKSRPKTPEIETAFGAVIYKGYDVQEKLHYLSYINEGGINTIKDRKLWLKANVGDSIEVSYITKSESFGVVNFLDILVIGKSLGDYSNISIERNKTKYPTTNTVPVIIRR